MCQGSMDLTQFVELICGELDQDDRRTPYFGFVQKGNEQAAAESIVRHHQAAGHTCQPTIRSGEKRYDLVKVR